MAGKVMDDLLYFGLGALAAEVVDVLSVKYADPKSGMNFASLKQFGKPSVYIPTATGAAALGYAAYQGDKFGRLKDEEMAMAGYGIYALVKTAGKVLAPAPVTATGMRIINGGSIPRVIQPQTQRAAAGYAQETNGSRRGSI